MPAPENSTGCGLFTALSETVIAPVLDPIATGMKVTLIAQKVTSARVREKGRNRLSQRNHPLARKLQIEKRLFPPLAKVSMAALLGIVTG